MVSSEHRTGLYIAVPVYFAILSGAAYWAHLRLEKMKKDAVSESLAAHYLGGRDFGPLVTAGTLFASLFSGYTVIGVPNDAYRTGWMAIDWIPSLMGVAAGYYGTGQRLLRCSQIREHQSPVDFITDRFQSQTLRYMILFLQVIPTCIYLSAQVIAIKGTFNSIFELDPDTIYPTIAIMALILVFEWAGGLNSVAYCDTIQAFTMIFSFVVIPSVIAKNFGGWSSLSPETYPKPEYYQTPTAAQQWDFWQFSLINLSFFTLPHLMQRTYSAAKPASLKAGYAIMTIGPWFTTFVGVYMGTMGVAILADEEGNVANPSNPFSTILEALMDLGGIPKIAGVINVTASLAAIMSTADSLIIAASQLITVEIVYPLRPNTTPSEISVISKAVSLGACVFAVLIGNFWDEGVSDLGKIQFALSAQAVPSFVIGLFATSKKTDAHPWSLFGGTLASTVFVIAIYFGYLKPNTDSVALNAGIAGILIQLCVIFVLEVVRRAMGGAAATDDTPTRMMKGETEVEVLYGGRPEWDVPLVQRFGETCLSPQRIWSNMEGIHELMANPWWCFMLFFVLSMSTPWVPEMEPPLEDGVFQYAPKVVNGLPWWFFKIICISFVPTVFLLVGINNMADDFPPLEQDGESEDDLKGEKKMDHMETKSIESGEQEA